MRPQRCPPHNGALLTHQRRRDRVKHGWTELVHHLLLRRENAHGRSVRAHLRLWLLRGEALGMPVLSLTDFYVDQGAPRVDCAMNVFEEGETHAWVYDRKRDAILITTYILTIID